MPPRKVFTASKQSGNAIPSDIQNNTLLNKAIAALLPSNYSFEVHKTIHQINRYAIQRVALQMPEGLSMYACALCDLIEQFTDAEAVVLGDVTYGACCVDDYTARALGCDMLVHYGHSCLIPVDATSIRTLYVFVEIGIDRTHLAKTVALNFPPVASTSKRTLDHDEDHYRIACVGTVQFLAAVQNLHSDLLDLEEERASRLAIAASAHSDHSTRETSLYHAAKPQNAKLQIIVPQIKPLSPGEILGCTAPRLPKHSIDAILYIGDGRFHLESIMIANPEVPAFRYDPYEKKITTEGYGHQEMQSMRNSDMIKAKASLDSKQGSANWAVALGTLGRQGSLSVMKTISTKLPQETPVPILVSELSPQKLALFGESIDACVQTSCPRLSIDWGYAFPKPLLTPYEASIVLQQVEHWDDQEGEDRPYAMDFWADDTKGPWTPRHEIGVKLRQMKVEREARAAARKQKALLQA